MEFCSTSFESPVSPAIAISVHISGNSFVTSNEARGNEGLIRVNSRAYGTPPSASRCILSTVDISDIKVEDMDEGVSDSLFCSCESQYHHSEQSVSLQVLLLMHF